MKKTILTITTITLFTFLIAGCKKDKDASPDNYLMVGTKKYELAEGFLENYGNYSSETGYNLDLTLISSGADLVIIDGMVESLTGTGNGVYFEVYTSMGDKLDIGDYMYDPESTEAAMTFDLGVGYINVNFSTMSGTPHFVDGGTLSVLKNGSEYEISFDCVDGDGVKISGYFKSSLAYFNYADLQKSTTPSKIRGLMRSF